MATGHVFRGLDLCSFYGHRGATKRAKSLEGSKGSKGTKSLTCASCVLIIRFA